MNGFDAYLDAHNTGVNYPVIFGGELIPANGNRGPVLLKPQTMRATALYLDRLQELGLQGVTLPIGYPIYTPNFPNYQEYRQFFMQVAQEVRKRGMTFSVESAVAFANTDFSTMTFDYSQLTFDQFEMQRKQMIAQIIQDLNPDYLNLGSEPDTEYQLTGFQEFRSPDGYVNYVNYILSGLDRGNTKIGAGVGTWGNVDYARSLAANTSLDSIHIHVYPVYSSFLQNILTIADVAKQNGKRVVLDEAWLSKADKPTGSSVASAPDIFRRDTFSFWAPLDQKFLSVIVKSARLAHIEYISPFWTQYFFGYVDYSPDIANLSFTQLISMANGIAAGNIQSDHFSSTGLFYRQLTGAPTMTSLSAVTSSGSTGINLNPTITGNHPRSFGLILALIAVLVAVGMIALVVAFSRRSKKS